MAAEIIDGPRLAEMIREVLADLADPSVAGPMQAYMKSEMPCRGVKAPIRRKACNDVFRRHRLESKVSWQSAVLDLWRNAEFREERYEAIDLTGFRYYDRYQKPDLVPMYEEMIVDGAWWDYVDDIAARRIGPLLQRYPDELRPRMIEWSRSDDMWKRRTSIICQLKFQSDTNLELLYTCIESSIEEKEFFLRKAIGWALRAYARVDPDEVRRYVLENQDRLSGLSRREAMKHL